MHVQRLTRLAEILEADAANPTGVKFDLDTWVAIPATLTTAAKAVWGNREDVFKGKAPEISCSTAACAMGLACLTPEFQEQGLKLDVTRCSWGYAMLPQFEGHEGFEAAAVFFDISWSLAGHLFDPYEYDCSERIGSVGELAVAKRIRALLAGSLDGQEVAL